MSYGREIADTVAIRATRRDRGSSARLTGESVAPIIKRRDQRDLLATLETERRTLLNLRDRARTLLQGLTTSPPPTVQYYDVVCPEGHRLRGQRTAGYQALRCPTCGEGIFVLPRSPLPEPPLPSSDRRSR